MLQESTRTLIIRYGTAILIIGFEGLSLISGKLIKDFSLLAYHYYYHFACGILLAKSFSWFNSMSFLQLNDLAKHAVWEEKDGDLNTSFYFFSFSFLVFYGVFLSTFGSSSSTSGSSDSSSSSSSHYQYAQVIETPLEDEEDQYGLEMKEISIQSDDDLAFEEVNGVVKASYSPARTAVLPAESSNPGSTSPSGFTDEDFERLERANEKKIPLLLRLGLYSFVFIEFAKGFLLGLGEIQSYSSILYVLFHGCLISLSFGILCEEYVQNSRLYNKFLTFFLLAYPCGLLSASVSPFNLKLVYFFIKNAYCALTGLVMVTTVLFALPLNLKLTQLIEVELHSTTSSSTYATLNKPSTTGNPGDQTLMEVAMKFLQRFHSSSFASTFKVLVFFLGYLLVLTF